MSSRPKPKAFLEKKQCGSPSQSIWLGYTVYTNLVLCLLVKCLAGLVVQPILDICKQKKISIHSWLSNAPWAPSSAAPIFKCQNFMWHFQCHSGNTINLLGYIPKPRCSTVQVFAGLATEGSQGEALKLVILWCISFISCQTFAPTWHGVRLYSKIYMDSSVPRHS